MWNCRGDFCIGAISSSLRLHRFETNAMLAQKFCLQVHSLKRSSAAWAGVAQALAIAEGRIVMLPVDHEAQ
jgi:hypothetical protein